MEYHYTDHDNQVLGPVAEDELHSLYRSGTITGDTNVFPTGATDWCAYRVIAPVPPPPQRSLAPVLYAPAVELVHVEAVPAAAVTQRCPFCAEDISIHAKKCKHCGETIDVALRAAEEAKRSNTAPMVFMNAGGASSSAAAAVAPPTVVLVGNRKSGLLAALLNLLIPGLGYAYCGRVLLGGFVFLFTLVAMIGTAGLAGLVLYPIFVIDGLLAAGRANRRMIRIN